MIYSNSMGLYRESSSDEERRWDLDQPKTFPWRLGGLALLAISLAIAFYSTS